MTPPPKTPPQTPARAVRAWPGDTPLAVAAWSAPHDAEPWLTRPRYTLLARPDTPRPLPLDALLRLPALATPPGTPAHPARPPIPSQSDPPIQGSTLLALPYELGHEIEPASLGEPGPSPAGPARAAEAFALPLLAGHLFDAAHNTWHTDPGDGTRPLPPLHHLASPRSATARVTPLAPEQAEAPARYAAAARAALDFIRAGDVYQVNLAHALTCTYEGSPRDLFAAALEAAQPVFAAYAELPGGVCVLSLSPELFLWLDGSGRVVTRPMKGTRPGSLPHAQDHLRHAEKDRAELAMIVDLLRNDLGRVAATGSVRVASAHDLALHGGSVWQATATVAATLRPGLAAADVLRAAFPCGSVTGAPKIRAMQIIRQLERDDRDSADAPTTGPTTSPTTGLGPRGLYCGSIGLARPDGSMHLSVAIRTAMLTPARTNPGTGTYTLRYPVGAGIVADSDPAAEYEETLTKASTLRAALHHTQQTDHAHDADNDRTPPNPPQDTP